MRQRTRLANAIRGHMAEYGIVAPSGREGLQRLIEMIGADSDERVPPLARACLQLLVTQLQLVNGRGGRAHPGIGPRAGKVVGEADRTGEHHLGQERAVAVGGGGGGLRTRTRYTHEDDDHSGGHGRSRCRWP